MSHPNRTNFFKNQQIDSNLEIDNQRGWGGVGRGGGYFTN